MYLTLYTFYCQSTAEGARAQIASLSLKLSGKRIGIETYSWKAWRYAAITDGASAKRLNKVQLKPNTIGPLGWGKNKFCA